MNKNEILGFILIGLVLIVWMWIQTPSPRHVENPVIDSSHTQAQESAEIPSRVSANTLGDSGGSSPDSLGKFFSHLTAGKEEVLVIRTDRYTAEVTTRGGLLRKWELNDYETWDGYPVQMVDPDGGGDFSTLFLSTDGKEIRTRALYFSAGYKNGDQVTLSEDESITVTFVLPVSSTKRINKRLTFRNGTYTCDAEIELVNLSGVLSNYEYQVTWETGVRYAEQNSVDESSFAMAYAYAGGELAEVDASSSELLQRDINGSTSWVATRNKYFAVAMIPGDNSCQGAYIEGHHSAMPDQGVKEEYSLSLKMPFKELSKETGKVKLFIGPLQFDLVKTQAKDLEKIISLGAEWIIRPISEFFMIPLFNLLHVFIPNFGVVIIVFSIIIKILLHPLSKWTMKSMKRMQSLQPLMNEIREKHKDDPAKMNQQIMNLYKEYGVNPAAGCLPLLLQMPILFALYQVFRSSIELRQASFFLWMNDLSVPDVAYTLPFSLPLLGISDVSGLAVAMGVTMFVQQKMTVTDPRQKAMVWLMPIMMTILFNGLPSGLNLYYFTFNLLSIAQQVWLKKHPDDEPLRKVDPKKKPGGLIARLTSDLPKVRR